MDPTIWAKAHGATTHFPIALTLGSACLDAAAWLLAGRPVAHSLRASGYWTILIGAAGSVVAVASGLLMTRGSVLGHGALRLHHLFVWPAFGLLIALAAWRRLTGDGATRPASAPYLVAVGVAAGLMLIAGYWGGEMMLSR